EVIHLKAGAGNIQLRYLDPDVERRLAAQQMQTIAQGLAVQDASARQASPAPADGTHDATSQPAPAATKPNGSSPPGVSLNAANRIAEMEQRFESFWWGGVHVDPSEQQKRIVHSVSPVYPDVARQAGLEGDVTLRVVIGANGVVNEIDALSGEPLLTRAAIEAV